MEPNGTAMLVQACISCRQSTMASVLGIHDGDRTDRTVTRSPILVAPCDEGTYFLDTDASNTALGTMLQQEQDGQLHVIGYASHALSHVESHYCIACKELLVMVYGLKMYRQHLLGRPIVVRTDFYYMKMPEPISQQERWLDLLSDDISIQHCPGRVHGNSDALSRRPCECDGEMNCRQCRRQDSSPATVPAPGTVTVQ